MGKLLQGIFGPITGKVGDMIYYRLNGQNLARHAGKRVKPFSEAQLASQAQMGLINVFLKTLTEFLNIGFITTDERAKNSAYNRAVSYNRMNAITGVYPDLLIDYSKVMVSKGKLPVAEGAAVELVTEGLRFSWLYASDMPYPRGNDRVMLLAYFPLLGSAVYVLEGANRKQGNDVLALPEELMTARVEVYIAFVAANGKSVSDSSYLGTNN